MNPIDYFYAQNPVRVSFLPRPMTVTAYHGSQVPITRFSGKHSAMGGVIWFSENYEAVKSGSEVGIQTPKYIMTVRLHPRKVGGWAEEDRYMLSQLRGMGYDSLKLDANWMVLDPSIIEYVRQERVRS